MCSEKIFEIKSYLTENYLDLFIRFTICDNKNKATLLKNLKINRYSFDCGFEYNGNKYFVEFDGLFHYTSSSNVMRDENKNKLCKDNNITLIRIPYFVQLTNDTYEHYFNFLKDDIKVNIIQNFPHGFIDKKATLPADFCYLGTDRFISEVKSLPQNVRDDIIQSLKNKIIELKLDEKYIINEKIKKEFF